MVQFILLSAASLFVLIASLTFGLATSFLLNERSVNSHRLGLIDSEMRLFLSPASSVEEQTFYQRFLQRFQGDFDNYNQVVEDRRRGMPPAEGGGHEHIHCTLVPYPAMISLEEVNNLDQEQWVVAAFYLNGNPKQIFRFRMYCVVPPQHDSSSQNYVRLKLHTLNPELDQCLRCCSEQPWTWWIEAYNMWSNRSSSDANQNEIQLEQWQTFQEGIHTLVSPLNGCDVLWHPKWNPSNHSYLYQNEYNETTSPAGKVLPEEGYHATMEAGQGGVIVDSISMIPGKKILIKDELSLWRDEFWINDRGYDPDAAVLDEPDGANNFEDSQGLPFVYGNRRGVPYKLKRVASMKGVVKDTTAAESILELQREIVNFELEWTLGDNYRTPSLYQQKINDLELS